MFRAARQLRLHRGPPNTRTFGWATVTLAQPNVKPAKGNGRKNEDVVGTLEKTPVVQTVRRRMQHRSELQTQAAVDIASPESKQLLKQVSEMEPLRMAWADWENTKQLLEETGPLLEDPDPTMRSLAAEEHNDLLDKLSSLAEKTFPSLLVAPSTTSHLSAMLEMKAGVGGSEAALFLGDIMRMYLQLAQAMGWQAVVVASNPTESGGVKDALLEIKGKKVYDTLRWESGVHRVQRVPATETSGRLHTSTVAVLVLPLAEDNGSSEVDEELFKMDEVRIEVMRSRGAGGQHVNKTESAVRLTHVPTGITVSMQDERSQHQNRRRAFQVLRARLMDKKLTEDVTKRRDARRNLVSSADRSEKIRTYNYPQDRVTDHRIGLSLNNLTSVMEGDGLQDFLDELAKKHKDELLEEAFAAS